ncbi:unnamed protein product [Rotaria sp. Silwood2]|nr:unnamed protein product [Rotaria sp. Silwood2]CAF2757728.1 unnamed protein product [Rotaria sp. Silwood2]CAF3161554.1 unnamed protein product [Rotaria sp. Silwood2]CAF4042668.1 unnamed protein product [Rotaria sp. Silwood2]CAF4210388.1 unnamed protein product [Rotaria sp. Silwood2]
MAKSSKFEDYWRQNNIESLFKELTHVLVQRMPSDPAVAIVQHLQKKFPKSFKTSADNNNNNNAGMISKTAATNLQSQPITSPRSPVNIENTNEVDMRERRASNQSQISGSVTIPTAESAFRGLFKHDTTDSKQAPETNLRNLVFANRLSQQAVKLGKDIRSDRDILEEELLKPMKSKSKTSSTTDASIYSVSEDFQYEQTHEQPSVPQLIKYKQHIRDENDRRQHREKLAAIAKQARDREQILQSDTSTKPDEFQQKQRSNDDSGLPQNVSEKSDTKLIHKSFVKSKEEEEILNDENIFQPRRERNRERPRNRLATPRTNAPYTRQQFMGRGDTNSMSLIPSDGICKVCGSIINNDENPSKVHSQQVSAMQPIRSFERHSTTRSVESSVGAVDDFFEPTLDVSTSQQMLLSTLDAITPQAVDTNPFQRNRFQPIKNNNNTDIVGHRPPSTPLINSDNKTKTNQTKTPRMSESDIFLRTSESNDRSSPSSRYTSSPVTNKHQRDTTDGTSHQLSKTMTNSSPSRQVFQSNLATTTIIPTRQRRTSGWSVCEHLPDDSDEN